jgi:DNA-directed RNA polymerase sigma subunit (sigma70/sigma32)
MSGTNLKTRPGLKEYLQLMAMLQPLEDFELEALLEAKKQGDPKALRELTEAFLPSVLRLVSPRRGEGRSFQELISLGNCAVIECLRSYRGSYAALDARICQAVHDALDAALKMNS